MSFALYLPNTHCVFRFRVESSGHAVFSTFDFALSFRVVCMTSNFSHQAAISSTSNDESSDFLQAKIFWAFYGFFKRDADFDHHALRFICQAISCCSTYFLNTIHRCSTDSPKRFVPQKLHITATSKFFNTLSSTQHIFQTSHLCPRGFPQWLDIFLSILRTIVFFSTSSFYPKLL
eukprot:Gb_13511 [translate_table: standard]